MSNMLRTISSLGVAALVGLTPVASHAATAQSLGTYQTTDRKMDFALALCGNSGKELCVTLAAARGDADTPQTHPFIGKYVVDHAKPSGKNTWKGSMTVQGYTMNGTLTLKPGVNFVMHGCAYVVVCNDFTLIPALQ
ncbi:MAG TPA: hypothetical protein VHB19_00430 [Devosia sp.]|jgi:uncharacterized protein (DUF2147 family)|nr:hypothetical protein [Devosia sp.]